MKEPLFGKTLSQIQKITKELGLPGFTAKQITDWLYKKDITSIEEMSNLSKKARALLSENFDFGLQTYSNVQESSDGTKKYLFEIKPGQFVESALIPETKRKTLCLSTQIGCKRRCLFCMTGKQGLQGDLTTGEILNQVRSIPEFQQLTNIVYMGMGEPLDNLDAVMQSLQILTADWGFGWSPRRITVSTIGIVPAMKIFAEHSNCHLAVSLHTPFDEERKLLMPVNQEFSLADVVSTIKQFDFENQRRISFEYIVFKGMNDTPRHVNGLASLLNGIKCRINLIRFHPIPKTPLEGTDEERLLEFKEALIAKGITTTIRASRGQDIDAACGLLSTKEMLK